MHPIYKEVNSLDKRCQNEYKVPEIIMMEHAAIALKDAVVNKTKKGSCVLLVCGPGNNGADGLACARLLMGEYDVYVYLPLGAKSPLAKKQLEILKSLHVKIVDRVIDASTIVDALFGSGARELDEKMVKLVNELNAAQAYKVACDLPTGLAQGKASFCADVTVTMGAPKIALYEEDAIDCVGEIVVADLGISRKYFEGPSHTFLLSKDDMILPHRNRPNVHKGNFGHLLVLGGQKEGASILAAEAGFALGAGLVSIFTDGFTPAHIMKTNKVPPKTTAIAAGMGLGEVWKSEKLREVLCSHSTPLVLDADLCKMEIVKECLKLQKPMVITPHPKEFSNLLFTCKKRSVKVEDIAKNRIELAREFSQSTHAVLVLKGAHTLIAYKGEVYISPFSAPSLAKGGSGDVLSGMIGALLAQGYEPKDAAITGVLAHVLAARMITSNSYALTPNALIERIKCL